MHTLSSKINETMAIIYHKTQDPYVEKFIQKPFIDSDKLFVLHYLHENSSLKDNEKQQYIVSMMLVQMALDTHETIPSEEGAPMQETVKQLTVLAGDFYSGLYYYLLAEMEDISMIRTLAYAIEQINEAKMTLYKNDCVSFDSFVQTIEKIETFLLGEIVEKEQLDLQVFSAMKAFLTYKRLQAEYEQYKQGHHSYMTDFMVHKSSTEAKEWELQAEMEKYKQHYIDTFTALPYGHERLQQYICDSLNVRLNKTAVEEG